MTNAKKAAEINKAMARAMAILRENGVDAAVLVVTYQNPECKSEYVRLSDMSGNTFAHKTMLVEQLEYMETLETEAKADGAEPTTA